jgi:hypothetical protein
MAFSDRSNRLIGVGVAEAEIVTLLHGWKGANYISMPVLTEAADADGKMFPIPPDVRVERVGYDQWEGCFIVLMSHHSFEEVPDGQKPPVVKLRCVTLKCYQIKPSDEADGHEIVYTKHPE